MTMLPNVGRNEVTIRQADKKELDTDLDYLTNLVAQAKAASDAVTERAKELEDKYKEHPHYCFKSGIFKKMATIRYKDNLEEERAKANEIFDTLEGLEDEG